MADISPSTAPVLQSTADQTPYVPVSWMAVAAMSVAALFAATLLVLGVSAFISKKPLLMPELLVFPVIAIVMSFAARRMIRNSEGTRTGEKLAASAWWISLVLGLGYIAYLFAIDFSVRKDAEKEVQRWIDLVRDDKDADALTRAFHRTLPPGARQGIGPTDRIRMRNQYPEPYLMFENCDLVKLAQRNRGQCDFQATGVKDWSYKPGMIDCVYSGKIVCPEGVFPIAVPLKGFEGVTESGGGGGGGRQWMVMPPQGTGFIEHDKVTRTPYGWLVFILEFDGSSFGKEFVSHLVGGPAYHAYLYRGFIVPGGDKQLWGVIAATAPVRLAVGGGLGMAAPYNGSNYTQYTQTQFFRLPGGGTPTTEQKQKFLASWNLLGVMPAGTRLKDQAGNVADKENIITITDTAIEVRVPIEIPLLSPGKVESARGRLVVECKDQALLNELKQLKAAADPSQSTLDPPEQVARTQPIPWRVVRIESDLVPVSIGPATQRGGAEGG
ncbi:MAG: hypothetical protein L0241_13685 [Planctomycetia bacterium]|nr:hypothetical protein [Planctomycetia bacterium]